VTAARSVVCARAVIAALCAVVALGVFFRFFHADWKIYSFDETVTSLRASGHTFAEFQTFVNDGRTHRIADLSKFQAADRARGATAVWQSLAAEDPQHPPLYFLLTRYSEELTGNSVFFRRLPAIIFGLVSLAAGWWFAYEVFQDRLVAWCFSGLLAIAPFHVVYAQQAREYTLWTLLICLSSATLLRALRTERPVLLLLYAVFVSLGLWSFTLFGLILVSHLIYVLLPASAKAPRVRLGAAAAIALGVISFSPWIFVMVSQAGTGLADTTWSATRLSAPLFLAKWIFNASTMFFDLDYLSLFFLPISLGLLAIAAWCCWIMVRRTPLRVWTFVGLLGLIEAAAFLVPDLILHETRSLQSRYLTPLWIAIELATAFGLVWLARESRGRARVGWLTATAAIFAAGVASCTVSSFAHSWWLANNDQTIPAIAATLRNERDATIVYVDDDDELLELAASQDSSTAFHLHRVLNVAGLSSATHPFMISRQALVQQSSVAAVLHLVPLPKLFPSGEDPAIAFLRRRAAADRHSIASSELALYQSAEMSNIMPLPGARR
jgi:uncharacterized membrane protein